jgi:hypothetical protein
MTRIGSAVAGSLIFGALAACGSSSTGGIIGDIPGDLGVQPYPSAFDVIAGNAGLAHPLVGRGETCPVSYKGAFLPSGEAPEAAEGLGEPITHPELLVLAWTCPSSSVAHSFMALSNKARQSVSGVADEADILDRTDDGQDGYPKSRVFIVQWREGRGVGALELAGADGDNRISAATAELIARRAASQSE